jgi:hypothetical protein
MRKINKSNKAIIVMLLIVLTASFLCMTNLNSIKADTTNNIAISYSTLETTQLGLKFAGYNTFDYPYSGFTYLIVNMTIENNGYDDFSTAPSYFYVIADNTEYSYSASETFSLNFDFYSYDHFTLWKNVYIQNGENFAGTMVFQIPEDSIIRIGYKGNNSQSQSYDIIWLSAAPSPAPTQITPTPIITPIPTKSPTPYLPPNRNAPHLTPEYYLLLITVVFASILVSVLIYRSIKKPLTQSRNLDLF